TVMHAPTPTLFPYTTLFRSGWRYDFDDASFRPAGPLPDWLLPLREKAAAFAGFAPDAFVHVLLARYDPGAGIGWHRDRDVFENRSEEHTSELQSLRHLVCRL